MILYLIRHGETDANRRRVFQGIGDVPLNETGQAQALALASLFQDLPVHRMYASPLVRAADTAAPVAEAVGLSVETVPAFREVDCGRWEGVPFQDILATEPELLFAWLTDGRTPAPEGESLGQVYERVADDLKRIVDRMGTQPDENVAIVAHGAVNRALICHLLDLAPDRAFRFDQHNGAVSAFEIRSPFPPKMVYCNRTDHLGGNDAPRSR